MKDNLVGHYAGIIRDRWEDWTGGCGLQRYLGSMGKEIVKIRNK